MTYVAYGLTWLPSAGPVNLQTVQTIVFLLRADFLSVCVAYNRRNYITIRASKSMFFRFHGFWGF